MLLAHTKSGLGTMIGDEIKFPSIPLRTACAIHAAPPNRTNAHGQTAALERENPMCPFLSTVWVALWESLAELSYSRLLLPLLLSLFPNRRLFWRRTERLRVREAWPRDTSSRTNILLPRSKKNATAITLWSRGRDRTLPSPLSLFSSFLSLDNAHLFFGPIDWPELKATRAPAAPSSTANHEFRRLERGWTSIDPRSRRGRSATANLEFM